MKHQVLQVARFGVVGVMNTALDLVVFLWLTRTWVFFDEHYLFAGFIAFIIAGIHSFFWHKYWTFRDGGKFTYTQLLRFYVGSSVALGVNECILWIGISLQMDDILSKLLGSAGAAITNFFLQKFWTFTKKDL